MLDSYTDFASVYDTFMDETPYDKWKTQIVDILRDNNINDGLVLDLGCGTGTMTELLAREGYDMTGVDLSSDMLYEAMNKRAESGLDILYLCQDMREFELYGTMKAIVSVCDSINYLTDTEDLIQTFSLVNNYLDPKGIFIFDFNTVHKYKEIGDSVIAENREDCSFIWDNYYDDETHINEYEIAFFIAEGDEGMFRRVMEQHMQRGYELEEIKTCLEEAGLIFEKAVDSDTGAEVNELTERVLVVARESGK